MAVLEFAFQSFWHFIGCVILIVYIAEGVSVAIKAIRSKEPR